MLTKILQLAWRTDWRGLKDAFKDYNVKFATVKTTSENRSRGFGIIKFSTKEDADAAIGELQRTMRSSHQSLMWPALDIIQKTSTTAFSTAARSPSGTSFYRLLVEVFFPKSPVLLGAREEADAEKYICIDLKFFCGLSS